MITIKKEKFFNIIYYDNESNIYILKFLHLPS